MADKVDPLVTLTAEARKHIDAMGAELDSATADIEAFEEMGIDVSKLKAKITDAKKMREIVLKRLT